MLPKELRLLSHEISTIKKHGKTLSHDGILLCFMPSTDSYSRFSFIVTKKAAKKAVSRNAIKRALRNFTILNYKKIQHPSNIVIIIRSQQKNTQTLIESITLLFKHI